MPEATAASPIPHHELLSVTIDSVGGLQAAYMPFVANGGLFIPTAKPYRLGEQVFLLLRLPEDVESTPLAASVVWIAPEDLAGGPRAGIGVQFGAGDESVKRRIERCLGDAAAHGER